MTTLNSKNSGYSTIQNYLHANIECCKKMYYQLSPQDLVMQAIEKGDGVLSSTGALVIDTGEFTGRSPKDRFIVRDEVTEAAIDWNEFNQPIEEKYFEIIFNKMMLYIKDKKIWMRDCYVCAKPEYRVNIRVINENPCCNLFAYNMFLRPEREELSTILPACI